MKSQSPLRLSVEGALYQDETLGGIGAETATMGKRCG